MNNLQRGKTTNVIKQDPFGLDNLAILFFVRGVL